MKYIAYIGLLCIIISAPCIASEKFSLALKNHNKQIALIIAYKDYQPVEYGDTKRTLEHAGFSVTTVSTKPGMASATDGSKTLVDKALNKFNYKKYDGIFLIGGPGAHTELDNQVVYTIMKNAYNAGKVVGAICYSPRILAKAGILHDKHATGWNDDNELGTLFKDYGVIYKPQPVVTDGTIITADGPMAAKAFGTAIAHMIGNK